MQRGSAEKKTVSAPKNLLEQAREEYPILNKTDIGYKENFQPNSGFLEFWPPDEVGTPERPRPQEFKPGQIGVEIYDKKTRPIDVLGDIVSHHLVNTDPVLKQHYQDFEKSLTPLQQANLTRQYLHEKTHYGEKRPYPDWYKASGLPGYFRGYPFQQWQNPKEMYTPEQMKQFDKMMKYLKSK